MGYDMYGCSRDPDGETPYYRLNIWGMGNMRHILYYAGILDMDFTHPPFPAMPEETDFDEDNREPLTPLGEEYVRLRASVLSAHGPDCRIPAYKFGSNDGWHVTPEECLMLIYRLKHMVTAELYAALSAHEDKERDFFAAMRKATRVTGVGMGREIAAIGEKQVNDWQEGCREFIEFAERCLPLGGFNVY